MTGAQSGFTSSGAHVPTLPASSTRPASTCWRTAVATIGLVIDASRQTASLPIRGALGEDTASSLRRPSASATPRITKRGHALIHLRPGEVECGLERPAALRLAGGRHAPMLLVAGRPRPAGRRSSTQIG